MCLDRSVSGPKKFGNVAYYITHSENHYTSINSFYRLCCRESFLILEALNILFPGPHPRDSDGIGLRVCLAIRILKISPDNSNV